MFNERSDFAQERGVRLIRSQQQLPLVCTSNVQVSLLLFHPDMMFHLTDLWRAAKMSFSPF